MKVRPSVLLNGGGTSFFQFRLLMAIYYNIVHVKLFECYNTFLACFQPIWQILFLAFLLQFIWILTNGAIIQTFAEMPDRIKGLMVLDQIRFVFVVLVHNDTKHFLERLRGRIFVFAVKGKRNFGWSILVSDHIWKQSICRFFSAVTVFHNLENVFLELFKVFDGRYLT